jgi:hypothetical protein
MKNDSAPHVSRRTFMLPAAATGSAGILSAVGVALTGARRSANKIRPQEERDGEPDPVSAQVLQSVV